MKEKLKDNFYLKSLFIRENESSKNLNEYKI